MKTILLLCTLLLTSCSSIPLATIAHFSDAKPEDFFTVDPKKILVKVSINSRVKFEPTRSITLSASIEDSLRQRTIAFPLEVVNKTTQAAVEGFFNDSPEFDIYIMKLAPKAIANLKVFHQERALGIKKRVGLSAGVNFSKGNKNDIDENTVLSVALKLTEQDEFITLIDRWKVEVGAAVN
ncbi:MAG: PBP1b-binding outer membrane lipoprotein LpoB [Alteromonadaceae bacterium]|jgi:PBP1b-binding outer membrane lipoprotein LpoB